MKSTLTLDFCELEIYDNILVVTINEGITVTPSKNDILVEISDTYFKNKPFVYISNRLNSYAVDPQIYRETVKIQNLKAFAVVSNDFKVRTAAEVEKLFFKKPFEIFPKLSDATEWAKKMIS